MFFRIRLQQRIYQFLWKSVIFVHSTYRTTVPYTSTTPVTQRIYQFLWKSVSVSLSYISDYCPLLFYHIIQAKDLPVSLEIHFILTYRTIVPYAATTPYSYVFWYLSGYSTVLLDKGFVSTCCFEHLLFASHQILWHLLFS